MRDAAAVVAPRLRGVLHQVAFVVSLATGATLVVLAQGGRATTAAVVYAVSVALLFGTSAAYHRGSWSPRARALMQRLDHSMIFVLIAGTYTPFALLVLEGAARPLVLGWIWSTAVLGVLAETALRTRSRRLSSGLYVALGWVALAVLPQLLRGAGLLVVALVVLGGLLYSAGAVVYARRSPDPSPRWFGFHEVFHAFTIAAFLTHYAAVSAVTYAAPGA